MKRIIKLHYEELYDLDVLEYQIVLVGDRIYNNELIINAIKEIYYSMELEFEMDYGNLSEDDVKYFDEKELEYLCNINNCNMGTVGYSQWSYCVSYKDVSKEFIRDIYEGNNWYWMELIENDEQVDNLGMLYIKNDDDLESYVLEYFGVKDFYLVDSDVTKYFDHKKVQEVVTIKHYYEV